MDTSETIPQSLIERPDQETVDEYDLAALGHGQALSRKFDLWSILALAFCVLGTWSTFAQVSGTQYVYFYLIEVRIQKLMSDSSHRTLPVGFPTVDQLPFSGASFW